jgi:drug/metabolite transporter (DMT)-like permease
MDKSTFSLICTSVFLSAVAQIVLKSGMSSVSAQVAGAHGDPMRTAIAIALNLKVLCGLLIYFSSAAVWLFVLARVNVGLAYPFVGLGFVMTMLMAWLFRGEVPSIPQVVGTLTICLGIVIMARV